MHNLGGVAVFFERFLDRFGEHDRAVAAAGAADRDRQIALSFADVVRNQVDEQAFDARRNSPVCGNERI